MVWLLSFNVWSTQQAHRNIYIYDSNDSLMTLMIVSLVFHMSITLEIGKTYNLNFNVYLCHSTLCLTSYLNSGMKFLLTLRAHLVVTLLKWSIRNISCHPISDFYIISYCSFLSWLPSIFIFVILLHGCDCIL